MTVIAICLLYCGMLGAEQTNVMGSGLVSRPVGVVALTVPSASEVLLSVPFEPFSPALSEVLRGQLTAATDDAGGDLVRFWDSDSGCYCTYEKDASGAWTLISSEPEGTNAVPPGQEDPVIEPGRGFLVANRHANAQQIMLSGMLVLDNLRTVRLPGGVTLVGYPFTSAQPAAETAIGKAGGTLTGNAFEMAAGYWHTVSNTSEGVWTEQRPYECPFPEDPQVRISGLFRDAVDGEVSLTIETGIKNRNVDLFKRDMVPADRLGDWRGWTLLAADLPIKAGQGVVWTDRTLKTDPAFKGVRLYIAACSDGADVNVDGVPDIREWLMRGNGTSDVSISPAADASESAIVDGPAGNPFMDNGGGGSNKTDQATGDSFWRNVVFVSTRTGSDEYSGFSAALALEGHRNTYTNQIGIVDGPKRSLKSGLQALDSREGHLIVQEGAYSEHLSIVGQAVHVTCEGKVDLGGFPAPGKTPADATSTTNRLAQP